MGPLYRRCQRLGRALYRRCQRLSRALYRRRQRLIRTLYRRHQWCAIRLSHWRPQRRTVRLL
jgi:hypothetical protein